MHSVDIEVGETLAVPRGQPCSWASYAYLRAFLYCPVDCDLHCSSFARPSGAQDCNRFDS